jgi:hypothetical protein
MNTKLRQLFRGITTEAFTTPRKDGIYEREKSCRRKLMVAIIAHRGTCNKSHIGCWGTAKRDLKYATPQQKAEDSLIIMLNQLPVPHFLHVLRVKTFILLQAATEWPLWTALRCWDPVLYIPQLLSLLGVQSICASAGFWAVFQSWTNEWLVSLRKIGPFQVYITIYSKYIFFWLNMFHVHDRRWQRNNSWKSCLPTKLLALVISAYRHISATISRSTITIFLYSKIVISACGHMSATISRSTITILLYKS